MTKTRNKVIRVNDVVKIITPTMFIRCGYALSFKDAYKMIDTADTEKYMKNFLINIGLYPKPRNEFDSYLAMEAKSSDSDLERKILNAIAFNKLKQLEFGGDNKRSLFTEDMPFLKDKEYRVIGKRVVKTGERVAGSSSTTYDGEYEWEPGYLHDLKTHIILDLGLYKIEACHVEIVR